MLRSATGPERETILPVLIGAEKKEVARAAGAAHAQGDGRVARREHVAVVRTDRRFLQSPPPRGEGDRRRRGGGGHQGLRPGLERAAPRGGARQGASRSRLPA